MNFLRIAARVAGPTLQMVKDEGYRLKAVHALESLEEKLWGWMEDVGPASRSLDYKRFLAPAILNQVLAKHGIKEDVQADYVEHALHEADHVLIDSSFKLHGDRDTQTSKNPADAILDEVVISFVNEDDSEYSNVERAANVFRDLATRMGAGLEDSVSTVLSKVSPEDPVRKKAWSTALRRAEGQNLADSAVTMVKAILDTLPLDRDPLAREIEEKIRSFYAQVTAKAIKTMKELDSFFAEAESNPDFMAKASEAKEEETERRKKFEAE